jgi:hypothetical protein
VLQRVCARLCGLSSGDLKRVLDGWGLEEGRRKGRHTDISCAAAAVDYVRVVGGCVAHFGGVCVSCVAVCVWFK